MTTPGNSRGISSPLCCRASSTLLKTPRSTPSASCRHFWTDSAFGQSAAAMCDEMTSLENLDIMSRKCGYRALLVDFIEGWPEWLSVVPEPVVWCWWWWFVLFLVLVLFLVWLLFVL